MDLNAFKANFKNGGARTNLFKISISNPAEPIADLLVPFRARGGSLPTSTVGMIEVPYMGRKVKVAGVKQYEDWNVTLQEDEDYVIRNALESWSNLINTPETNVRDAGTSDISAYKSTAIVEMLSQTGAVLRTYKFIGLFPTVVSAIDLDWENEGIQSTQVTFAYDYFIVENGNTGDAGGI
jgi:hypothetical protein